MKVGATCHGGVDEVATGHGGVDEGAAVLGSVDEGAAGHGDDHEILFCSTDVIQQTFPGAETLECYFL